MRNKINTIKDHLKGMRILIRQVPRERLILGSVVMVLICLLIYHSLSLVQEHKLKIMSMQYAAKKKQLDYFTQIVRHADVLQEQLKEAEKNYDVVRRRFLNEAELAVYFDEFRHQAQTRRLAIVALDFSPMESPKETGSKTPYFCKELQLYISVKGNFYDTVSFLHHLEYENPKIFDIDSVTLTRGTALDEINANIRASIYILEDE